VAYAPYGEDYDGSGTQDLAYTDQNQDTEKTGWATNLYDFMFREYRTAHGRWASPDPAGLSAVDPSNPQSWNRYAYVNNNPMGLVDPTGLDPMGNCMYYLTAQIAKIYFGNLYIGSYTVWAHITQTCTNPGQGAQSSSSNAGNIPPPSPKRQQCEQEARQKYANAQKAIPGIVKRGALVGAGVAVTGQVVAGCILGGGAGTFLGGTASTFLGGTGAFGGAAVGCPTGAISAVMDGIPQTVLYGLGGAGISYGVEKLVAKSELSKDLEACSKF
jgi:RHS repeat-associated protein